ncbi:hypothetical protein [Methylocystis heyeri]|uniref:Uncharacterized protein n=1 Tax=Methylocystis heyeri TaxID=391905 RepID=A0A6B8KCB4_9HYPH|nr:hypothetical protein [Methylocystis heyeri]QGM44721.1 hypothetical protein H2LOC_002915 [Methylocystis heyeri]
MKSLLERAKVFTDPRAEGFDAEFYYQYYKDLAALKGAELLNHYKSMGIDEGRFKNVKELMADREARYGSLPDDFDRESYKAINKDISKCFAYGWEFDVHYIEFGRSEGRRYKNNLKIKPQYNERGQRRCVYGYRGDGLGTRFLTIIYAKILADMIGFELKYIWQEIGSPFYSSLFQPDKIGDIFLDMQIFSEGGEDRGEFLTSGLLDPSLRILRLDGDLFADMNRESFLELVEGYDVVFYEQPFALLKFMSRETDIASEVKRIWRNIAWSARIEGFIDRTCSTRNIGNAIAIHIRRGDIIKMLVEADVEYLVDGGMVLIFQRFTAMRSVMDAIDKVRVNENILVCSDDSEVVEVLSRKFGVDSVYSSYETNDLTDDQRSAIDIMLLSRAKILISPYISYFSKCAAEVGECKHIPIQLDLPSAVHELIEIADKIPDGRALHVKALVYRTAAGLSSDDEQRAQFLERAEFLEASAASS